MKKLLLVFPLLLILQACYVNVDEGRHTRSRTTLGQELMDLDRARENGSVSEHEYDSIRLELIETYQ